MAVPKWMDPMLKGKKGQKVPVAGKISKKRAALLKKVELLWEDHLLNGMDERYEPLHANPLDEFVDVEAVNLDSRPLVMESGGGKYVQGDSAEISSNVDTWATESNSSVNDELRTLVENLNQTEGTFTERKDMSTTTKATEPVSPVANKFEAYVAYTNIIENLNNLIKHCLDEQNFDEVARLTEFAQMAKKALNRVSKPIVKEKDTKHYPTITESLNSQIPKEIKEEFAALREASKGVTPEVAKATLVAPKINKHVHQYAGCGRGTPVVLPSGTVGEFLDRLERAGLKLELEKPKVAKKTKGKTLAKPKVTKKAKN